MSTTEAVKARGIPFRPLMVRACRRELEPKTQTRRALQNPHYYGCPTGDCPHETQEQCRLAMNSPEVLADCPYGGPGTLLYVKEAHRFPAMYDADRPCMVPDTAAVWYEADGPAPAGGAREWGRYRHGRFMRRAFSRVELELVSRRLEPLDEISEADAIAEGLVWFMKDGKLRKWWPCDPFDGPLKCAWQDLPTDPRLAFRALWEWTHGPGTFNGSMVWVIEFKRLPPRAVAP